jgi:hypothetical protein
MLNDYLVLQGYQTVIWAGYGKKKNIACDMGMHIGL